MAKKKASAARWGHDDFHGVHDPILRPRRRDNPLRAVAMLGLLANAHSALHIHGRRSSELLLDLG